MIDKGTLITGGTGSLGLALAKELPRALLLTNNELELVEARKQGHRVVLGDVRDYQSMSKVMEKVDLVIHAAALKHVPICEDYPIEAVKTNILGSINVINAAKENNINRVLAISSDKAVNPINTYGGTKFLMERLFINAGYSCVRFGNFESSRGSVMPLMEQQAREGKRITITHKEMTRFWVRLDNAAQFVIKCVDLMNGGEIFIPKMSEKSIMDIMRAVVPDAPYKIIGKRRGEKLHELLFAEGEEPEIHDDYFVIRGVIR